MTVLVSDPSAPSAIPVRLVTAASWPAVQEGLDEAARRLAKGQDFAGKAGAVLVVPGADEAIREVLFGVDADDAPGRDPFRVGALPALLPRGLYRLEAGKADLRLAALAFALGSYRFTRYRKAEEPKSQIVVPAGVDGAALTATVAAVTLARDLINTPANDMGPAELETAARKLATAHGGTVTSIIGDDLLGQNLPLIHAVGASSPRAPRLIDMRWGDSAHPRVTLVGKGVCFDSGGLDIKPESAMLLMKKDMAGAATVLALANLIMARNLKVRLRVLIPAVENAVSGRAFRPLDVYSSRKGLSVEIGNTDAEGRLVLADALALADEENPDLLIDLGTLTGAARVALGPELPPFYTRDDTLAADIARAAAAEHDPLWRMPLWAPYDCWLDSKVADLSNVASGGFAGSITCALFLQRFVSAARRWLHIDIYGWNPKSLPGRPEGGECQAARALFALLSERYG